MTNASDLARRVAALFSSPKYHPLPERDLAKTLRLEAGQRGLLRAALRELEAQGLAAPLRGGRWGAPPAPAGQITGLFRVRLNGSAWLFPDDPQVAPLSIDPEAAGVAMNGDRIQAVPVRPEASRRMFGARPDTRAARVVRVIERKRQWVVGILQATPHYAYVVPRDPLLRTNIKLTDPPKTLAARVGHLVVAKITEDHPAEGRPVTASFAQDLGDPDAVENDIPALLLDRGFSETFPEPVQKAARRVQAGQAGQPAALRGRVDLRAKTILTIDPASAHDYDDAVSIEPLPNGRWRLGVHIADVAAYVEPGSDIDREALRRGNSTYLVDRVIRMLPEDLTVRICSLQPGEDHLTHTVDMVFDPQGELETATTYRSVIRSKACLSYDQVQAFFDTGRLAGGTDDIRESLRALRKLAKKIRTLRFRNGALDFALPEVHCDLDAQGNPIGFTKRASTEAYNLIEECMLAANRVVARKIFAARLPGIFRVHDGPSEEQWTRMAEELRALGHSDTPGYAHDLNRIARAVLGRPDQYITTLTLLRNMKRAVYANECRPHFGLGFKHYAHFTSPIRRYPDLVLHRILIGLEEGRKHPACSAAEIAKLAVHCSETERESAELEIQSILTKRIRYYAARLEAGETGPFQGTIISLNPKGLIVELQDTLQQGLLPYSALGHGRYAVSDDGFRAASRQGGAYRLGQPVEVALATVDERLKRIDFFLPEAMRPGRHKHIDKQRGKVGNKRSKHPERSGASRRPTK
ncbi:MAG TPA: VacB/RNase II family 3'-5' exoribonuclease [Kiritimatiellia bacterium]|nr:VacB/RNase II family 3'-5' exoribonuclease [Kiritimatiellia bacterium]